MSTYDHVSDKRCLFVHVTKWCGNDMTPRLVSLSQQGWNGGTAVVSGCIGGAGSPLTPLAKNLKTGSCDSVGTAYKELKLYENSRHTSRMHFFKYLITVIYRLSL